MEMSVDRDIWYTNILHNQTGTHARHNANTERIPYFVYICLAVFLSCLKKCLSSLLALMDFPLSED